MSICLCVCGLHENIYHYLLFVSLSSVGNAMLCNAPTRRRSSSILWRSPTSIHAACICIVSLITVRDATVVGAPRVNSDRGPSQADKVSRCILWAKTHSLSSRKVKSSYKAREKFVLSFPSFLSHEHERWRRRFLCFRRKARKARQSHSFSQSVNNIYKKVRKATTTSDIHCTA